MHNDSVLVVVFLLLHRDMLQHFWIVKIFEPNIDPNKSKDMMANAMRNATTIRKLNFVVHYVQFLK